MTERESIVAWLRREVDRRYQEEREGQLWVCPPFITLADAAHSIERYADKERPEPTIPYETWRDEPSVG